MKTPPIMHLKRKKIKQLKVQGQTIFKMLFNYKVFLISAPDSQFIKDMFFFVLTNR